DRPGAADETGADEFAMSGSDHQIWLVAEDEPADDPSLAGQPDTGSGRRIDRELPRAGVAGHPNFDVRRLLPFALLALAGPIASGLASCLRQTLSLRRKLAGCTVIGSGPARRLLDELRRSVPRAPDVRILSAPGDVEPAAFGLSRWTIVLPE